MREVSRDEFFEKVYKDKLNVHPTCIQTSPTVISEWRMLETHKGYSFGQVYGRSIVEYVNGRATVTYFLA